MMCIVASALAALPARKLRPLWLRNSKPAGAFSYVRAKAANGAGFDLNGGSASVAYNFGSFAIVGDFGGYRFSG